MCPLAYSAYPEAITSNGAGLRCSNNRIPESSGHETHERDIFSVNALEHFVPAYGGTIVAVCIVSFMRAAALSCLG